MKRTLTLHVNGDNYDISVRPHAVLLDVLRDQVELTGTNESCRLGYCGACTVLLDGTPVNSCMVLALDADGRKITTVEGLAHGDALHPLQQAFVEHGAIQCGFCSAGMITSAAALLEENPHPTEAEVRYALAGNLCRCTGYVKIVEAVLAAAEQMADSSMEAERSTT